MNTKILFTILGGMFFLIVGLMVAVIFQQKTIKNLSLNFQAVAPKQAIVDVKEMSPDEIVNLEKQMNEKQNQQIKDNTKQVSGEIKSISGATLAIDAQIIDPSAITEGDATKPRSVEIKVVAYSIKTDKDTKFEGAQLAELKVGDLILVTADSSIFGKTELVATGVKKIEMPAQPKDAAKKQ